MDMRPTYIVPTIHLYHVIVFVCTRDDYFHHFVFAGIICPLGFYYQAGPIQNAIGYVERFSPTVHQWWKLWRVN